MKHTLPLLLSLTFALLTTPAFAQLTNLKQHIADKLNNAEQDHDQQLQNAENPNTAPIQTPNTPAALAPDVSGWIELPATDLNTTKVRLYIAHPNFAHSANPAKPNLPALVVVQEWWGVNDDIIQRTEELAAKGYYAVAVDLYDGQVTADPKVAATLKDKLTDNAAQLRLKTGLNFLMLQGSRTIINRANLGVIGWCMGATQSQILATTDPRIKAAAIFYPGNLMTDPEKLANLKGPYLGMFGDDDPASPPDALQKLEASLTQDKIPHEIHHYAGAGHAFASKAAIAIGLYRPTQAADAWQKTYAWLAQTLPTPANPPTTAPTP